MSGKRPYVPFSKRAGQPPAVKRPAACSSGLSFTQKARAAAKKPFVPITSPDSFARLGALIAEPSSKLVALVGPVGCGKSYGVAKIIAEKGFFSPPPFDASETNLAACLDLACRRDQLSTKHRVVVVEDVDGYSDSHIDRLVSYFSAKWRPLSHASVVFTLASFQNRSLAPLRRLFHETLFVNPPTPARMVAFFKAHGKVLHTQEQLERMAAAAAGDVRRFGMALSGNPSASSDATVNAFRLTEAILRTRLDVEPLLDEASRVDTFFLSNLIKHNAHVSFEHQGQTFGRDVSAIDMAVAAGEGLSDDELDEL